MKIIIKFAIAAAIGIVLAAAALTPTWVALWLISWIAPVTVLDKIICIAALIIGLGWLQVILLFLAFAFFVGLLAEIF